MYKLIEWDNENAYWLIIIKDDIIIKILLNGKNNKNPLIIDEGGGYSFSSGIYVCEKLLGESNSLEEVMEIGMIHML